jgi:hypothetical protein
LERIQEAGEEAMEIGWWKRFDMPGAGAGKMVAGEYQERQGEVMAPSLPQCYSRDVERM